MINHDFVIIGVGMAFLALAFAWMFMTSRVHYMIRVLVASLVVVVALINWTMYKSLLGYSVNDYPPDKSIIISFIGMKEKKLEYLWIYTPEGPKSYALPYDENLAQKLTKGQEEAKKKGGYMVYRRGKGDGKGGEGEGDEGDGQPGHGQPGSRGTVGTNFTDDSQGSNVQVVVPLPPKD